MTDNEIIKSLECCCTLDGVGCQNCPQYDIRSAMCVKNLIINALNLIHRQKAEIKRLTDELHLAKVEISKCFDEQDEAIKEFAERLKENIRNAIDTYYNSYGGGYYHAEDTIDDIDNLVKEMTEVDF